MNDLIAQREVEKKEKVIIKLYATGTSWLPDLVF